MENLSATSGTGFNGRIVYKTNASTVLDYKKVLHVTPFFPPDKGGIADHVFNLCLHLTQHGHRISILAPKHINDKIKAKATKGLDNISRIPCLYLPGWPYPTLRSLSIPLDLGLKLRSLLRKGQFDIVHVHGHHYPLSWIAIQFAHKHNIPSVLTAHGMYALDPNVLGGKSRYEDCFNKHILSKVLAKTTATIGLTKEITDYLKQFGKKSTTYYTIGNGVDTHLYEENLARKKEYRCKYGIDEEAIVILFIGRFVPNKGIIEFTQATKNVLRHDHGKKVEILIVGDGPLQSDVHSILNHVSGVHLLKYQPHDEVYQLYIASDMFVIPSKFEGLPITVLEAMSAGLHIVYTPVGGIPEILEGYSSKTMLKNTSTEEIQRALTSVLIGSESLKSKGNRSVTYVQDIDWKRIACDVNKLYSELNIPVITS